MKTWHDIFNDCLASYHVDPTSDHCFLLIKCICPEEKGYKPFKFYNMWVDHPSYKEVLSSVWCSPVDSLYAMTRLVQKLSKLRNCLGKFNKEVYGDVVDLYNTTTHNLKAIQSQVQINLQDHSLLELEKEPLHNYSLASSAYEKFLHRRSKITWLRLRDSGTSYFSCCYEE